MGKRVEGMMVDEVLEEEQNRVGDSLDSLIIEMNKKTLCTLRGQINVLPPPIHFSIVFQPSPLIRTPRLVIIRKSTFFVPLISFHFFVSTIHAQYSWQNRVLLHF